MTGDQRSLSDVLYTLYHVSQSRLLSPSRSGIQSLLFLSASLAPIGGIDWQYSFVNAPFGPFNREISQAADSLVVQRRVEAVQPMLLLSDRLRSQYRITLEGELLVRQLHRIDSELRRSQWIESIVHALKSYDIVVINKMAKREPTYEQMRLRNQSGLVPLLTEDNQSVELIGEILKELRDSYSLEITHKDGKIVTYFDYLSNDIGVSR